MQARGAVIVVLSVLALRSEAAADPFVEAALGAAKPIDEAPLGFEFDTSPMVSVRAGESGTTVGFEAAVSYTWLQATSPLRPTHDRVRLLFGGRVGRNLGARARVFARLAVGGERLRLHTLIGTDPDTALVEVIAATLDGYAVDAGGGILMRLGRADLGLQTGVALAFFDEGRHDHHLELLLTVGTTWGAPPG